MANIGFFSRIVLQQALYLHGGFSHSVDSRLGDAQCSQLVRNAHSLRQAIDEVDATLSCLLVILAWLATKGNSHLSMPLDVSGHIKLHHGRQEYGVGETMRNVELASQRIA